MMQYVIRFVPRCHPNAKPMGWMLRAIDAPTLEAADAVAEKLANANDWYTWYVEAID